MRCSCTPFYDWGDFVLSKRNVGNFLWTSVLFCVLYFLKHEQGFSWEDLREVKSVPKTQPSKQSHIACNPNQEHNYENVPISPSAQKQKSSTKVFKCSFQKCKRPGKTRTMSCSRPIYWLCLLSCRTYVPAKRRRPMPRLTRTSSENRIERMKTSRLGARCSSHSGWFRTGTFIQFLHTCAPKEALYFPHCVNLATPVARFFHALHPLESRRSTDPLSRTRRPTPH